MIGPIGKWGHLGILLPVPAVLLASTQAAATCYAKKRRLGLYPAACMLFPPFFKTAGLISSIYYWNHGKCGVRVPGSATSEVGAANLQDVFSIAKRSGDCSLVVQVHCLKLHFREGGRWLVLLVAHRAGCKDCSAVGTCQGGVCCFKPSFPCRLRNFQCGASPLEALHCMTFGLLRVRLHADALS